MVALPLYTLDILRLSPQQWWQHFFLTGSWEFRPQHTSLSQTRGAYVCVCLFVCVSEQSHHLKSTESTLVWGFHCFFSKSLLQYSRKRWAAIISFDPDTGCFQARAVERKRFMWVWLVWTGGWGWARLSSPAYRSTKDNLTLPLGSLPRLPTWQLFHFRDLSLSFQNMSPNPQKVPKLVLLGLSVL